jgi:RNA polymerase sigma-70 factor, ECF subfamily
VTEAATDERGLVRRMRAGEEAAFDQFFEGHFSRLYRFALARMNQDADAAEDVVQVTLCKAVDSLKGYRFEAGMFTWLCTICRHEIAAYYERRGRRPEPVSLAEDSPEVRAALDSLTAPHEPDPERQMLHKDVARLVQVTLDALPSSYGDALEWKYVQGLSVKEIAARLNLGIKAAESLLTRAREAFRGGYTALTRSRWSER